MIFGNTWFVQVDTQIYGPYTTGQMHEYMREGRILETSWVSTNPNHPFRPAHDFQTLSQIMSPVSEPYMPNNPYSKNSFGMDIFELTHPVDDAHAQFIPDQGQSQPQAPFQKQTQYTQIEEELNAPQTSNLQPVQKSISFTPSPIGSPNQSPTIEGLHSKNEADETVILIMAEMKTERTMTFLKALQLCGIAERIGKSIWLVRTSLSASQLRNRLSHTIGENDRLFIMDSFNGQTAWFNIGSDMDSRMRNLWNHN